MKKALLFSILCLTNSVLALAQTNPEVVTVRSRFRSFDKGTWLVGLQGGRSAGLLLGSDIILQGYGGYFVTNQVFVGLREGINQERFEDFRIALYSLGPLVRIQLTRTRISPFIMLSCQIGNQYITGGQLVSPASTPFSGGQFTSSGSTVYYSAPTNPQTLFMRSLGTGLSFGLIPSLRLDLLASWQDKVPSIGSEIWSQNIFPQFQIGANYAFGHRR